MCSSRAKKKKRISASTSSAMGGARISGMTLRSSAICAAVHTDEVKAEDEDNSTSTPQQAPKVSLKKPVLIDPITLETISPERAFELNGSFYDIVTLSQYFSASKNFVDPLSMESLTEEQVLEMDMKAFSFVMSLKNNKSLTGNVPNEVTTSSISPRLLSLQMRLQLPPRISMEQELYRASASSPINYPFPIPPSPFSPTTSVHTAVMHDNNETEGEMKGDDITNGTEDEQVIENKLHLPSLLPLYRKVSADMHVEIKNRFNTVQTYDSIIGGLVAEIMELMEEDAKEQIPDFNYKIMQIVSELEFPWKELKSIDHQAAFLYLQSYKSFLRGPIKKPTHDPNHRLINIILVLDQTCLTQDDTNKHERERRERSMSYDITTTSVSTSVTHDDETGNGKRSRASSC